MVLDGFLADKHDFTMTTEIMHTKYLFYEKFVMKNEKSTENQNIRKVSALKLVNECAFTQNRMPHLACSFFA